MSETKPDKMTLLHIPDLTPWLDTILRLCLHPAVQVGFDRFLAALVGQPRTAKELTALLAEMEQMPEAWATVVRQRHVCQDAGNWLTVNEIAKVLQQHYEWINKQLAEHFPNTGEIRLNRNGNLATHYPLIIVEKLNDLAENFPVEDDWLTAPQIAKRLGRSAPYVYKLLADLSPNIGERRRSQPKNQLAFHYPPAVVSKLQERADFQCAENPPADGWVTNNQIAKRVNKSHHWVRAHLSVHFSDAGEMRYSRSGRVALHYPLSVLPMMQRLADECIPADDWLTLNQLAKRLDRSDTWVSHRLATHFPNTGEMRCLPHNNKRYLHYPPSVLIKLQAWAGQHSQADQPLPADGWLTPPQIAKEVGKGAAWVYQKLTEYFSETATLRRNRAGSSSLHYPLSVLVKLREWAGQHSQADVWLTLLQISVATKKSRYWVNKQLADHFPETGETRQARGGNSYVHYPPTVLPKLKELSQAAKRRKRKVKAA